MDLPFCRLPAAVSLQERETNDPARLAEAAGPATNCRDSSSRARKSRPPLLASPIRRGRISGASWPCSARAQCRSSSTWRHLPILITTAGGATVSKGTTTMTKEKKTSFHPRRIDRAIDSGEEGINPPSFLSGSNTCDTSSFLRKSRPSPESTTMTGSSTANHRLTVPSPGGGLDLPGKSVPGSPSSSFRRKTSSSNGRCLFVPL